MGTSLSTIGPPRPLIVVMVPGTAASQQRYFGVIHHFSLAKTSNIKWHHVASRKYLSDVWLLCVYIYILTSTCHWNLTPQFLQFICKAPESPLGACHPMVNLDSNLQIETSSRDSWTNKNTMDIGFVSAIFITLLPSTSFLATKWRSLSFNGRTGISSGFESHVHKRVKSCWN